MFTIAFLLKQKVKIYFFLEPSATNCWHFLLHSKRSSMQI